MKYLILSDIHSNLEALTAVLRRIRRKHFDRVVVLGDLVGYGADPNPIVDRVRGLKRFGHHPGKPRQGLQRTRARRDVQQSGAGVGALDPKKLLPRHRRWLASLPRGPVEVDNLFAISHGTPLDEDAYIFGEIEALNMFPFFQTQICFFGHSHFPVVFGLDVEALTTYVPSANGKPGPSLRVKLKKGTRYLINPGSIGQPRDGDNRASFGILDSDRMTMAIHRVAYDYGKTQAKIRAAGLPSPLADRLALGR